MIYKQKTNICIVLLDIIGRDVNVTCFNKKYINHIKETIYSDYFPHKQSRLINIKNNCAFVIGGQFYNFDEGYNLVYKINYEKVNNDINGVITCRVALETLFYHALHCVIYCQNQNLIFVLTGTSQTKCEYGILDSNKDKIEKWKEFSHIRYPRPNCVCCLLNERYIFLIGDFTYNENKDLKFFENYEIFDVESLFDSKIPRYWNQYDLPKNNITKILSVPDNLGVVQEGNNVYILGGNKIESEIYFLMKILFANDNDNDNDNQIESDSMKIKSILLIDNKRIKEFKLLKFLGQQLFFKLDNWYFNLSANGEAVIINKNYLD